MRCGPPTDSGPLGVYVHFPFCHARCTYCDFPTVAGRDDLAPTYLDALEREISSFQPDLPGTADTVYVGGGTPSLMEPADLERVLSALRGRFDLAPTCEITLEGNPESLTRARLEGYRRAGVSRISVGVQSLDDRVLRETGRLHDARQAAEAVGRARESGFADVSLDLIAGLPGESLSGWPETVREAADMGTEHVSVYLLETDKQTPLSRAVRAGRVAVADSDSVAWAYEQSVEVLEGAGLRLYEISSFARDGHSSRHNLKYWTDRPFAGFGLGAHGYHRGERRANRSDLDGYLRDVGAGRDPVEWKEGWDAERRLSEALVLGLRLAEGIDLRVVADRYDADPRRRHAAAWDRAGEAGLVVWEGQRVRLTPWGRLRCNELFADLI